MRQIFPLLILIGYFNQNANAQNKGAEDFSAIKKYFTVKSSNGSFLELTPTKEGLGKYEELSNKTCYGIYVQTDDFSGAISAAVTLMSEHKLEFSEQITHFRQDSKEKFGKRGYLIIYKKKKGEIPKSDPLLEFN